MPRKRKPSDKLRDVERPTVLGFVELNRETLTPVRYTIDVDSPGDHGCDPLPDGRFRMVPSGDIVDVAEKRRRLDGRQSWKRKA